TVKQLRTRATSLTTRCTSDRCVATLYLPGGLRIGCRHATLYSEATTASHKTKEWDMESRLRSKVTGLAAGIALTVAMAGPASAAADSGIRHHPCPNNNTGVITLQLRGTGNTWGPGD